MDQSKKRFEDMRRQARATAATRLSRKELAQVALLKDAHQERIVPILESCPIQVMNGGDVLLRAGEACKALYIVLSGRLRMHDPAGEMPDTFIRAGDVIGEVFLLDKAVLAATVTVAEPARVLVIDRGSAWALLGASHEIARNWLLLLAERTAFSGTIAGSDALKTSHKRYTTHDEITGLNNRHWLESMLPRQIARNTASKTPLGLLLVEIDAFADYAIKFGQDAADLACRTAAEILVNNLRPTDSVVCYGTALFAVVLPESNAANGCIIAERVRHAVSHATALMPDDSVLPAFTVSIGVTQFDPPAGAAAFLADAEAALHMAKATGGDRVGMQG